MGAEFLAGICLFKENKTLLLKQPANGPQPEAWGPPGGHGDIDESPEQTAVRETKEETGLDVEIADTLYDGDLDYQGRKFRLILYSGKPKDENQQINIQSDEVADFAWINRRDLINNKYLLRDNLLKDLLLKILV